MTRSPPRAVGPLASTRHEIGRSRHRHRGSLPGVHPRGRGAATDLIERVGKALGARYRVERRLGEGSMAVVLLVFDRRHHRRVALKVLRPAAVAGMETARFLREIRVLASLRHPNILPLIDSGESDGLLYYATPHVDGLSLRERLDRDGALTVREALRITGRAASALASAHERGIVHRDVKPENILLAGRHVWVADFGIARAMSAAGADRLTRTGMVLGTPTYVSPEQVIDGRTVDGRTDQYGLACTLFELLAGRPPFDGRTADVLVRQHLSEPPPTLEAVRADVPWAVSDAVARAMAKDPADRFADMNQLAEALGVRRAGGVWRWLPW